MDDSGCDPQQGRLADAVFPLEPDQLAAQKIEVDALEDPAVGPRLRHLGEREGGRVRSRAGLVVCRDRGCRGELAHAPSMPPMALWMTSAISDGEESRPASRRETGTVSARSEQISNRL